MFGRTKSPYVRIRRSSIHNKGVFAKRDIPAGRQIIEYVGEKITKKESDRRYDLALEESRKDPKKGAVYLFELNKRYDIDGDVSYNPAKYINHSCEPNCESENRDGHIWIVAQRDIKKGDELSYDYGYDIDSYKDHPCRCGAPSCPGYIVAEKQRPKLRRLLAKEKKKKE